MTEPIQITIENAEMLQNNSTILGVLLGALLTLISGWLLHIYTTKRQDDITIRVLETEKIEASENLKVIFNTINQFHNGKLLDIKNKKFPSKIDTSKEEIIEEFFYKTEPSVKQLHSNYTEIKTIKNRFKNKKKYNDYNEDFEAISHLNLVLVNLYSQPEMKNTPDHFINSVMIVYGKVQEVYKHFNKKDINEG
ncbi:hypothetical protein [Sinobaca sp. H24]|uniref:hypothetical protein n=1 Tax=Sinobaca sp. H24 TaxID=2923376 RepID=UPI00207A567E|nr:hypothetical protein [Sinobaca sp. H24]